MWGERYIWTTFLRQMHRGRVFYAQNFDPALGVVGKSLLITQAEERINYYSQREFIAS